jgi:peptidoglycan/LPS O-acetylase OafA/YrhL
VLPLAAGLVGLGMAGRWAGWNHNLLLSRPDGLVFGCILATLLVNRSPATERALSRAFCWAGGCAAAGVTLLAVVFWGNPEPQWRPVSFPVFAAFYACAIGLTVVHSGHPWLGLLRSPWLRGLGLLSYPLYLTHLPVMHYMPVLLARTGIASGAVQSVATWVGVFAAAVVLHRFVERPALAMKDRWRYAPGQGAAEAGPRVSTTVEAAALSR